MSQQGDPHERQEDDWWRQLYDDDAGAAASSAPPDSIDAHFDSALTAMSPPPPAPSAADTLRLRRPSPPPPPPSWPRPTRVPVEPVLPEEEPEPEEPAAEEPAVAEPAPEALAPWDVWAARPMFPSGDDDDDDGDEDRADGAEEAGDEVPRSWPVWSPRPGVAQAPAEEAPAAEEPVTETVAEEPAEPAVEPEPAPEPAPKPRREPDPEPHREPAPDPGSPPEEMGSRGWADAPPAAAEPWAPEPAAGWPVPRGGERQESAPLAGADVTLRPAEPWSSPPPERGPYAPPATSPVPTDANPYRRYVTPDAPAEEEPAEPPGQPAEPTGFAEGGVRWAPELPPGWVAAEEGEPAAVVVGGGPPTYAAEPTAWPEADPEGLDGLVPDTVLDGAQYGVLTLRTVSVRGDSARYRGQPRRDALLTARFGAGDDALLLVAMASGARAADDAHRAAQDAVRWIAGAVGRSRERLAEDLRAERRGSLKSGLHRLTDRCYGRLRARGEDLGLEDGAYTASLRCLLLPADPGCRIRLFFGLGDGGLFRVREGAWQDLDLAPDDPGSPFRFRATVAQPGDALLMCSAGLAEPLRGEPQLAGRLAERWSEGRVPGLAAYLADVQTRVKGYADDRTAVTVWDA